MPDTPRIEDLRRRVQKDPASIAFAQLAEEYRRAGQCREAVEACHAGLSVHPGYLSARVTLGRAFLELGQIDDAQRELETVLKGAPENLAAIRGLAEVHQRNGALGEALRQYRAALVLARNDPELQETVNDLEREVAPARRPDPSDGSSQEQMQREMAARVPPSPPAPARQDQDAPAPVSVAERAAAVAPTSAAPARPATPVITTVDPGRDRAVRTVAALESWLSAVHAAGADRQS